MGSFIKSLCLTLLFFAYTGLLIWGGTLLEKRVMDIEKAEQEAKTQLEINEKLNRTAEEYHKHYELVVSRIKTSEAEGMNKDAIKDYISGYDDRFKAVSEMFYADCLKDNSNSAENTETAKKPDENIENTESSSDKAQANVCGTSFPMMYSSFKKAFDEAELNTYKALIKATTPAISEEEIETIFKD